MLNWILFESQLALGVLSVLTLFGLLVHRANTGNSRPVLVGLALIVILFAIQSVVTTDREQVRDVLSGVVRDVMRAETTNLRNSLSSDFSVNGMNAEAFCDFVDGRYDAVRPVFVREIGLEVSSDSSDMIKARVSYWHDVKVVSEGVNMTTQSHWLMEFVDVDGELKIRDIQPDGPFRDWRGVGAFR